jgi:transcription-repair coupling factor (superfamily II helicase)
VGDPVVHINHGIGRYQGLINIDLGDGASEFLHLEYADKATLYVPVAQLHLISRYTGVSADEAPLHKLGSPASGTRPSARPPSRCATPPPSC